MASVKITNTLYLTVLPMIQVDGQAFGLTQQVLTLMPEKNFASRFFPDEVEAYILTFRNRTKYLTGGHVKDYALIQEPQPDGRVVVRVEQYVE
jgi:hypothetical protein